MGRGFIAGVAAVLAIALVTATGCGGSSDSGSSGSEGEVTRAAFIAQGDKICGAAEAKKNAELKAALIAHSKKAKTLSKAFEEELVTTVALPPIVQMTEELAALDPPKAEAAKAKAVVSAFEDAIVALEAAPATAISGAPFAEPDKLALAYGFKLCGQI